MKTCPQCEQPWPEGRETVGNRVCRLRIERGLTIRKLAGKVGIMPSIIAEIENGAGEINNAQAMFLADAFGVTVDYLTTGNLSQDTEVG